MRNAYSLRSSRYTLLTSDVSGRIRHPDLCLLRLGEKRCTGEAVTNVPTSPCWKVEVMIGIVRKKSEPPRTRYDSLGIAQRNKTRGLECTVDGPQIELVRKVRPIHALPAHL